MANKTHFSPASEEGHFYGLVDEGRYLRQSSLYKQILPRPVRRSFSEGGTPSRQIRSLPAYQVGPRNLFTPLETCLLFLMGRNPWLINDLRACKVLYICRVSSTDAERSLQNHPFLTNKANFRKSQMNVNTFITTNYEQRTMNYEIKNKANSKPIQTQYKANTNPIQSQFKPKQTQFSNNTISEIPQSIKLKASPDSSCIKYDNLGNYLIPYLYSPFLLKIMTVILRY